MDFSAHSLRFHRYVFRMSSGTEDTVSAPLYAFTAAEHSALVIVVTVVSSLLMLTALAIKIILTRSVSTQCPFDALLFLAAFVSVVQTITTVYAGHLGLGNQGNNLDYNVIEEIRQVPISITDCAMSFLSLLHPLTFATCLDAIHIIFTRNSGHNLCKVFTQPNNHKHQRPRAHVLCISLTSRSDHTHQHELTARHNISMSTANIVASKHDKLPGSCHDLRVHRLYKYNHGQSPVRAIYRNGLGLTKPLDKGPCHWTLRI